MIEAMRKILLVALWTGAVVGAAAPEAVGDEWEILVNSDIARIDLNVSSIEKGPHGGIQAYVLTMHPAPQKAPNGAEYKNSTQVLEWDCNGQRTWLHGIAYEMKSKLVDLRKYPDAKASRFMPPETLGGATERAACSYFRRKGLL
ncbi:hypothetical protein HYV43_05365 [Candidatus Micrarchaeota archaeon]|nr:hypothetical protein [Candidatus Micrarchaeota archaeon]